jgi:predicted dehydrogenase
MIDLRFAKEQHLPAIQQCPDLELKAVYSRSLKSAKSVAEDVPSIDTYSDDSDQGCADLLSRTDIQAVIIALPIMVQPDFIKQALKAGKHVLAEKPLANDIATGVELIDFYNKNIDTKKVNFSIAEQFRYYAAYIHAAKQVQAFGKVVGCKVQVHTTIKPDMKYMVTEWRKKPQHQGGFILDGGVHFIAGIRHLLSGQGVKVKTVSAFTTLLQDYLPPVDTVDAIFQLDNGRTGTFSVSVGTTFSGGEWSVACENGTVSVDRTIVTTKPKGGEEKSEDVPDDVPESKGAHLHPGSVVPEVFAWAKSLKEGKWDARQSADEGLADLEILEAMLKSGERGGEPIVLKHQM